MHYKTMILELLQDHPNLDKYLRLSRKLMSEMERYASDLRTAHLRWKDQGVESSAALELALEEIQARIAQEAAGHNPPDAA